MSVGAMKELLKACLEEFGRMVNDLPKSEKRYVLKVFEKRAKILEGM